VNLGIARSNWRLITLERKVRYKVKLFFLDGWLRPRRPLDMVRFGTYYGGWWIPRIDPSQGAAVCVGAGLDVSFDLELLRLGYRVYAVDPTPAAVEFVTRCAPDLTLVPVGVWDQSGEIEFQENLDFDDMWTVAAVVGDSSKAATRFPVMTVKDLLASIGEPEPAILKLDIEGAEHAVLSSLVSDRVRPRCVCVEFDDQRVRKILRSYHLMRRYGYKLYQIENFNFTFVLC
jgi:FkbM family methyltransferase